MPRRFSLSRLFRKKRAEEASGSVPYDEETQHYVRRPNVFRGDDGIPAHLEKAIFAAGCFWGTEKSFWRLPGVYSTAVVYVNGKTDEPTYREVCTGRTGHAEATLVYYDPREISLADLLRNFWRCHDPTQGNGQGNDRGSQYRSGVYVFSADDEAIALASAKALQPVLRDAGFGQITTEIVGSAPKFFLAETYHQQYLAKPGNRQYCSAEPTSQPLPKFESWDLSAAHALSYRPKLPAAFWKTYDGSIKAPHKPATWTGGADATEAAEAQAAGAEAEFAAALAKAEETSGVLIRYCSGCGFAARAMELAEFLRGAVGVVPTLLPDIKTTGRFTVLVRTKDGAMSIVHSKSSDGGRRDGFVDTCAKLKTILQALVDGGHTTPRAVEAALLPDAPTPLPKPV